MSNLAQAHAMHEALHEITHIMNDVALSAAADTDQAEHCGVDVCCHSIAVPLAHPEYPPLDAASQHSAIEATPTPRLPLPEIERPKWALATHAVASF